MLRTPHLAVIQLQSVLIYTRKPWFVFCAFLFFFRWWSKAAFSCGGKGGGRGVAVENSHQWSAQPSRPGFIASRTDSADVGTFDGDTHSSPWRNLRARTIFLRKEIRTSARMNSPTNPPTARLQQASSAANPIYGCRSECLCMCAFALLWFACSTSGNQTHAPLSSPYPPAPRWPPSSGRCRLLAPLCPPFDPTYQHCSSYPNLTSPSLLTAFATTSTPHVSYVEATT